MGSSVLVVDDEATMRNSLARLLSGSGYSVRVADSARAALGEARKERPDLVLLDVCLPDTNGLEVLTRLKQMNRRVVVIVMTAYESTRGAVLAMKQGAYDYLGKPFNIDAVRLLVRQALEAGRDRGRDSGSRDEAGAAGGGEPWQGSACDRMIARSPAMKAVLDVVHRIPAGADSTILIEGETGTGKELLARAVHEMSGRAAQPFLAVSCGAIPRELVESELFGYEKGAFTGALRDGRQGAFERAGAGTIFLDEIGELGLHLQVKLLRVLEAKEFSRVGGAGEISLRARAIAATNRDLGREVEAGRFRADLYFRLNVLRVKLPPLRDRRGDILPLAEAFMREYDGRFGKSFGDVSPGARKFLEGYAWPGNVRELRNVIERAVLLEAGEAILPEMLGELGSAPPEPASERPSRSRPDLHGRTPASAPASAPGGPRAESSEKERIVSALERTGGNVVRAARLLGLRRGALRYRMDKYGIPREWPYLPGAVEVHGQDCGIGAGAGGLGGPGRT